MGQASVILVISVIIIGGVLLLSMGSATQDADDALNEYQHKELARDAATTGMNLAVRRLAEENEENSWDDAFAAANEFPTTSYGSSTFRVELDPVPVASMPAHLAGTEFGDLIDVTARGFSGTRYDAVEDAMVPISEVIFARYIREYADGGIPPAFRNVITTNLYLQLSGNVSVRAINSSLNASVHTNGDLQTNGNSFFVEGYGTYSGVELTNQEDNFVPNIDYNGPDSSNVFWQPPVDIPLINMDSLRTVSFSQGTYINTAELTPLSIDGDDIPTIDFTGQTAWPWEGTYEYRCPGGGCGTKEKPFVLFVEGPLNFLNRVKIKGYGVIATPYNVYINPLGNTGGVTGELNADDEVTFQLATLRNIDIEGNAKLADGPQYTNCNPPFTGGVSLYAYQHVYFRGTPCLVGGIVTPEAHFDGGGSPTITYAAPTEEITDLGFDYVIPIGPILVSYSAW